MPEKEKVKDVQALADTLDSLPETVKQRILGVAEGYQLAIDASKEKERDVFPLADAAAEAAG